MQSSDSPGLDVLLEARGHYLSAEDLDNAIAVTARISGYLQRRGYYSELIRLNQELLDLDKQPAARPTVWIAQSLSGSGRIQKSGRVVRAGPADRP